MWNGVLDGESNHFLIRLSISHTRLNPFANFKICVRENSKDVFF